MRQVEDSQEGSGGSIEPGTPSEVTPQIPTPVYEADNTTRFIGVIVIAVVIGAFLLGLS